MSALETAKFFRERHLAGNVPDYEDVLAFSYRKFLKPGMAVLDIGAHAGRHTAQFLQIVGPEGFVWAFEPIPVFFQKLRNDFRSNKNIEIIQAALSQKAGSATFKYVENYPGESGLRERVYNFENPIIKDIVVNVTTLDAFFRNEKRKVDFVKIDVEGAEIDILRSGPAFIEKNRPIISIEYGSPSYAPYGNEKATLFDLAQQYNYLLGDLFGNLVTSREEWQEVCDLAYWDYFMTPSEKADEWRALFGDTEFPADFPV